MTATVQRPQDQTELAATGEVVVVDPIEAARPSSRTSPIGVSIALAATSSIAAGALHVAAGVAHGELVLLADVFLALGAAQLAAGAALLATPSRRAAVAVVAVNLAAVAGWAATRLVGIGWIEGLGQPEAPQIADTVTAALGLAAALATWSVARRAAVPAARRAGASLGVVLLVVLSVSTLGVYGASAISAHHHEGAAAGAPWRLGATGTELRDTRRLIRRTQAALADYPTVAAAEAQGFVRINEGHLLRVDRVFDEHQLDPAAIESLIVNQRDGQDYIAGAMYLMDIHIDADAIAALLRGHEGDTEYLASDRFLAGVGGAIVSDAQRDVPRFGGPLMVWHSHGGFCFELNGVIDAGPEAGGSCPAGSVWIEDPPMVHVYLEPQVDDGVTRTDAACGTFTYMDLPFDYAVPGCGGAPVAHDHFHAHA